MTKVLLLGSTGMLGSMLARAFAQDPCLDLTSTARGASDREVVRFDAGEDSIADLVGRAEYEWIVNAIGVIKSRIDESDPASITRAMDINASFPHRLAAALRPGQRAIQIATDGVFSGLGGPYDETAAADATDVYGKSKSLGEVAAPYFVHLRCSIIGPERGSANSLLSWLLSQEQGSTVSGFTNQRWNGITSWHFAKLCSAVFRGEADDVPSPLHVVPADTVSKAELLRLALDAFGRSDVHVVPQPAGQPADRTLSTRHPEANRRLWSALGYNASPTIATMVAELAAAMREQRST